MHPVTVMPCAARAATALSKAFTAKRDFIRDGERLDVAARQRIVWLKRTLSYTPCFSLVSRMRPRSSSASFGAAT